MEAILGLVSAMCMLAIEAVMLAINATLALTELVVGLFIEGFALTRLESSRKKALQAGEPPPHDLPTGRQVGYSLLVVLVAIGLMEAPVVWRKISTREIVITANGQRAQLARVYLQHAGGQEEARRADLQGVVRVPRWGVTGLRLDDFRYARQTWAAAELTPSLQAEPSTLAQNAERARNWWRKRK